MPRKSRQKTAVYTEKLYCRKCQKEKVATSFPKAVDPVLDTNGYMSICATCCNDLYESNYVAINEFRPALRETCRMLNVAYIEEVADGLEKRILAKKAKSQNINGIFGMYRQTLAGSSNVGANYKTLTFSESTVIPEAEELEFEDEEQALTYEELVAEWGKGYEMDEYEWLESNYQEWANSYKSDTPAEQTLLKEIVWKKYEIHQARQKNEPTGNLSKELQDLMKTAAVDPAKQASNAKGKSHETFSDFITTIEEKEPAEVYGEQRDAFVDWQNIEKYFESYVVRPIKNFVVGSKDFSVDDDLGDQDGIQDYLDYNDDDEEE